MSNNHFSGSIPTDVGNFPADSLEVLDVSFNRLGGTLPDSLLRLDSLEQLDLSFNEITGDFPGAEVAANLGGLIHCDLRGNPFFCPVEAPGRCDVSCVESARRDYERSLKPIDAYWQTKKEKSGSSASQARPQDPVARVDPSMVEMISLFFANSVVGQVTAVAAIIAVLVYCGMCRRPARKQGLPTKFE